MTFDHPLAAAAFAGIFAFQAPSASAQAAAVASVPPLPTGDSVPQEGVNGGHTVPVPVPVLVRNGYAYTLRAAKADQRFEVRTEQDVVIARCIGQCTLGLPQGSYNLGIYDQQGNELPGTSFEVTGPGQLQFEPANTRVATAGAVMGSVGGVLLLAGSLLVASAVCIDECAESDARSTRAGLGLVGLAAGAALTPIGWYLFKHNIRPKVETSTLSGIQLAAAANREGGFLGIKGSF